MKKYILLVLLLATPAAAQNATPSEQAMGARIIQEVQASLTCNTSLINAQAEIAKAQAEIKALKEKYEPKPETQKP